MKKTNKRNAERNPQPMLFARISRDVKRFALVILAVVIALSGSMLVLSFANSAQHKSTRFAGGGLPAAWVELQKYERDINGEETTKPVKGAMFTLHRVTDEDDVQIGTQFITDNAGRILPLNLAPGQYYFTETKPPQGYVFDFDGETLVTRYDFQVTGLESIDEPVRITAYNRRLTGELTVAKTVQNADGSELTAQQSSEAFEFLVEFFDNGDYSYIISDSTFASAADAPTQRLTDGKLLLCHGQSAVFAGVPTGTGYRVTEISAGDYIIESHNHEGDLPEQGIQANFINTYNPSVPPDDDAYLTVVKVVEGEVNETDLEELFIFNVTIDDEEHVLELKNNEESQPLLLPFGVAYTVSEQTKAGWQRVSLTNGQGTGRGVNVTAVQTNRYTSQIITQINGVKSWDMQGHDYAQKPESITVFLMQQDTIAQMVQVTPDADGNWQYTFSAPKHDHEGNEIIYTIDEAYNENYTAIIDGFDLTNRYDPPEVTESPTEPSPGIAPTPTVLPNLTDNPTHPAETAPPNRPSKTNEPGNQPNNPPPTGDINMMLWQITAILSGLALILLIIKRQVNHSDQKRY